MTQDICDKAKTLIEFSQFGKSVAEIGEEHLREIHMYSYRILYEATPDAIYIHCIIHKRRDFKVENIER